MQRTAHSVLFSRTENPALFSLGKNSLETQTIIPLLLVIPPCQSTVYVFKSLSSVKNIVFHQPSSNQVISSSLGSDIITALKKVLYYLLTKVLSSLHPDFYLCFIDLSAAFDVVDHKIFLD